MVWNARTIFTIRCPAHLDSFKVFKVVWHEGFEFFPELMVMIRDIKTLRLEDILWV